MKIGIIGSGRVAVSMGKYLSMNQKEVIGFYNPRIESAKEAADFVQTDYYSSLQELVMKSDLLFVAVPDQKIQDLWQQIKKEQITNKVICHFSGSLSSDVFFGREKLGAYGVSLHPLMAFSSKFDSYLLLEKCFFTMEGDTEAKKQLQVLFETFSNQLVEISKEEKSRYHLAASMLSNHVTGLLEVGYSLLQSCGFEEEQAREASRNLVLNNVLTTIDIGGVKALTGPIERGDDITVASHFQVLEQQKDENIKAIYMALGRKLVEIAKEKNSKKDYEIIEKLLEGRSF